MVMVVTITRLTPATLWKLAIVVSTMDSRHQPGRPPVAGTGLMFRAPLLPRLITAPESVEYPGGSKILPLRALGRCGGYASDIIDAMRWAAGLSVHNMPSNPNQLKFSI